ncbi:MAG: hypothetical protein ACYSR8_10335 [Planctomycetota bacterium]
MTGGKGGFLGWWGEVVDPSSPRLRRAGGKKVVGGVVKGYDFGDPCLRLAGAGRA